METVTIMPSLECVQILQIIVYVCFPNKLDWQLAGVVLIASGNFVSYYVGYYNSTGRSNIEKCTQLSALLRCMHWGNKMIGLSHLSIELYRYMPLSTRLTRSLVVYA